MAIGMLTEFYNNLLPSRVMFHFVTMVTDLEELVYYNTDKDVSKGYH